MANIFTSPETLGVAMVQCEAIDCLRWEEVEANLAGLLGWMDRAVRAYPGVDLIVFPECSLQGAHPDADATIETEVPGPVTEALGRRCRELGVWAYFNVLEKSGSPAQRPYNTSLLIDATGTIVLKQRKINPFVPLETALPGDRLDVCPGPKGTVLGIMLCYDGDFPEVARELAYRGATVLLRPAAYMEPYSDPWVFVNQSRAYENLAYVVAVNRVGTTHQFTWFGGSMAVDYDGRILTQAPRGVPWLTKVDLHPGLVRSARATYRTCNHLHNLTRRGYAGLPPHGDRRNVYTVYRDWLAMEDEGGDA